MMPRGVWCCLRGADIRIGTAGKKWSNTNPGMIPIKIITISTYFSYSVEDAQGTGTPDPS
jgi:hypothetical protein